MKRYTMLAIHWLLAAACSPPFSTMSVRVALPGLPAVWAGADAWEVSWTSCSGSSATLVAKPGSEVVLELPRSDEAAVYCTAVFGVGRSLPYGALWPQGLDAVGVLHPGASGGYACALAAALYRSGASHSGFDLPRFAMEAEARMADPWDVDPVGFAPLVAESRFRADHLGAPEHTDVSITGIPCAMSPDSPWGSAIEPDGSGLATVSLAPGRLRRWMGGGYVLSVCLSVTGEAAWTLSAPPP
jgi:hypothetical protein